MIDVEERNDVTPVCPHCEQALSCVNYQKLRALLGQRYVYFCGACKKVLGISHRKGFWMG